MKAFPLVGCGAGLRAPHYPEILEKRPRIDWFEAVSENYMDSGGRPLHVLEKIRGHYPLALHGTSLSIGSADPLNENYLRRLKRLIERIDPFLVSDHLCWSGVGGQALYDLLPLPFTEEALAHVVSRVDQVQNFLGRRFVLENVSTYVTYRHSEMPEWEFVTEAAKRSGCALLLDINNVYVNAANHNFDPREYLRNIPAGLVAQIHLAGHTDMGRFLFDTHSRPVIEEVWRLYREGLALWGPVSTLIEWDEDIPPLERLMEETEKANAIYAESFNCHREEAEGRRGDLSIKNKIASPPRGLAMTPPQDLPLSEIQLRMKSKITPYAANDAAVSFLNPQGGESGEERLSVYAGGYIARIRETLAEVYEAVRAAVGEESFSELARAYAGRYPSADYNLNFAGRNLAAFLEGSAWQKKFPFAADLARLEWLVWKAFHAFDERSLAPQDLQEIPLEDFERALIVFQPSAALLQSRWPVIDLWLARNRNAQLSLRGSAATEAIQRILIGRRGDQVRCELLDGNQFLLLEGLLAGETLGAVCEKLADKPESDPPPISEWFRRWIQDGLILSVSFSGEPAEKGSF